jgi:hypothetical protein
LSALSEIKRLKLRAAKPPNLDDEQKNDWRVKAGYALGYQHALEEAAQIIEEETDGVG